MAGQASVGVLVSLVNISWLRCVASSFELSFSFGRVDEGKGRLCDRRR